MTSKDLPEISHENFEQVAELFELVRMIPADQRKEYLERRASQSPSLIEEVRKLLGHHDNPKGILGKPISLLSTFGRATDQTTIIDEAPPRIGAYHIQRILGRGGMGIVYLAEQDNPGRQVALKVIRPALIDPESRGRFEFESRLLGRLKHHGIAQVYEAGVHKDEYGQRPWFVMELVRGLPLLAHSNKYDSNIKQKLALMVQICESVHYAHQKGIVHRDLKPANILVAKSEDDSKSHDVDQTKILDFGVAKTLESEGDVSAPQTQLGQFLGTPAYMSPEQITGEQMEVDTRSDVYALGVILYELLSGDLPYAFRKSGIMEAARVIRDVAPSPLTLAKGAFSPDLNAIVMHALEKNIDQRYQSARELGEDIKRYLNGQPVLARTPSIGYVARKFASRHKAIAAAIAITLLSMVASLVVSAGFAIQKSRALAQSKEHFRTAQEKQEQAEENLASAQAAIDRLTQLSNDLSIIPGTDEIRKLALNEVLSFYEQQVTKTGDVQSIHQSAMALRRIAILHSHLGNLPSSLDKIQSAQASLEQLVQDDPTNLEFRIALADSYFELGAIQQQMAQPGESATSFLESNSINRETELLYPEHDFGVGRGAALNNAVGGLLGSGDRTAAIATNLKAIELFESLPNQDSFSVAFNYAIAIEGRANLLLQQNNPKDAIPLLRKALAMRIDAIGESPSHPSNIDYVATSHKQLAATLFLNSTGQSEWFSHAQKAVEIRRKRWTERPDRFQLGFAFSMDCWSLAECSRMQKSDEFQQLHSEAIRTLSVLETRFADSEHYSNSSRDLKSFLAVTLATCPVKSLRDKDRALSLLAQLLESNKEAPELDFCNSVVQAFCSDKPNVSLLQPNLTDQTRMLLQIAINTRTVGSLTKTDREFINQVNLQPESYLSFDAAIASRILEFSR